MIRCTPRKNYKLLLMICGLTLMLMTTAHAGFAWQGAGSGIMEPEVKRIAVHPSQPTLIYAASESAVYASQNSGKDFNAVLNVPSADQPINTIFLPDNDAQAVFVATNGGVYMSRNYGEPWRKIFQPSEEGARQCRAVAALGDTIYIGTLKGLYYRNSNEVWAKTGGTGINGKPVFHLEGREGYLFAATDQKLFRLKAGEEHWTDVFSTPGVENFFQEEAVENEEAETASGQIKALEITDSGLYAATAGGIFHSGDYGDSWQRLDSDAVPLAKLTALAAVKNPSGQFELLAATETGAFRSRNGQWETLYRGLLSSRINDAAAGPDGRVLAATGRGLMELKKESLSPSILADIKKILAKDPSIHLVQKWAVDYAEVHPNKISSWRRRANTKAFLPKVTLDLDRDAGDYYHWDTGQNPDQLVKGLDYMDWGVSVSWDFGEWIWNPDQTSIDSRSKLMVELRESILDQVTRLYFERRRLQAQTAAAKEDVQAQFDQQMRIDELTALIDGFTGGRFSRYLEESTNQ